MIFNERKWHNCLTHFHLHFHFSCIVYNRYWIDIKSEGIAEKNVGQCDNIDSLTLFQYSLGEVFFYKFIRLQSFNVVSMHICDISCWIQVSVFFCYVICKVKWSSSLWICFSNDLRIKYLNMSEIHPQKNVVVCEIEIQRCENFVINLMNELFKLLDEII